MIGQNEVKEITRAALRICIDLHKKAINTLKANDFQMDTDGYAQIIMEVADHSPYGIVEVEDIGCAASGIMFKGIYLYSQGGIVEIFVSSDPKAKYEKRFVGSFGFSYRGPYLKSEIAELIPYDQAPEILQKKADRILPEIHAIIIEVIDKVCTGTAFKEGGYCETN